MDRQEYARAFTDGYNACMESMRGKYENPLLGVEEIRQRYDGKIGKDKAYEVIKAVRHCCGGGMLGSASYVMLSELVYWENNVNKTFVERI